MFVLIFDFSRAVRRSRSPSRRLPPPRVLPAPPSRSALQRSLRCCCGRHSHNAAQSRSADFRRHCRPTPVVPSILIIFFLKIISLVFALFQFNLFRLPLSRRIVRAHKTALGRFSRFSFFFISYFLICMDIYFFYFSFFFVGLESAGRSCRTRAVALRRSRAFRRQPVRLAFDALTTLARTSTAPVCTYIYAPPRRRALSGAAELSSGSPFRCCLSPLSFRSVVVERVSSLAVPRRALGPGQRNFSVRARLREQR